MNSLDSVDEGSLLADTIKMLHSEVCIYKLYIRANVVVYKYRAILWKDFKSATTILPGVALNTTLMQNCVWNSETLLYYKHSLNNIYIRPEHVRRKFV